MDETGLYNGGKKGGANIRGQPINRDLKAMRAWQPDICQIRTLETSNDVIKALGTDARAIWNTIRGKPENRRKA
jgi:hypothetical protein